MNVFGGRANSIKSYLSLSMDLMGDEVKSTKSESSDLVDKTERPWPVIKKGFNRFFQSKEDAPEKKLWKKLRGFIAAELPNERPKGTNCVIGKSVVLGKNVKLSNSILMDGVNIEDDCTLILFEFLSYLSHTSISKQVPFKIPYCVQMSK